MMMADVCAKTTIHLVAAFRKKIRDGKPRFESGDAPIGASTPLAAVADAVVSAPFSRSSL